MPILWVLRAFFQSIPHELEEAALVDGAGRGRTVWYVVLPLALPGLIRPSGHTGWCACRASDWRKLRLRVHLPSRDLGAHEEAGRGLVDDRRMLRDP